MRAFLGDTTSAAMLRIERILQERGWQTDRGAALAAGHYEIVLLERDRPDPAMRARIAAMRRRFAHDLLLVVGTFTSEERSWPLAAGADDLIDCAAPATLIMARLLALLGLRLGRFQERYHVGELTVDLARRRVRRGAQEILLSQREFQLLILLAEETGTILPRSVIIERLWADVPGIGENAVDALASRLRRRIDGPFGDKMLRTVRGVGYCLSAA